MVNLHDKITTMYERLLRPPNHSFFLFGPRTTGKTTWLRKHFPKALWKNLLLNDEYLSLLSEPSSLRREVEALPKGSWIIIDEIQRIPSLLNEVHDIISNHGEKYFFAMSGSSARKLKRLDVNLLAGRAIERKMFPFVTSELKDDYNLTRALTFGNLPPVIEKPNYAIDILKTYVGTYLKQEIQQEALVEDIGAFHRFLKIAGIMNGEVVNVSGVSRDSAVSRTTTERYFEILIDTLIGFRLPGWQPKLKVREKLKSKFYLFDPGVVRALTDRIHDPLSDLEVGKLFETLVLGELRAAISYQNIGGELSYWRSAGGLEVDFIWSRGESAIAIEVKSANKWKKGFGKALNEISKAKQVKACFGVYRGKTSLKDGNAMVYPWEEFVKKLHSGELFKKLI